MDDHRFDDLTRTLASGASRRSVLRGMFGAAAGAALSMVGVTGGSAKTKDKAKQCRGLGKKCHVGDDCCSGACDAATSTCVEPAATCTAIGGGCIAGQTSCCGGSECTHMGERGNMCRCPWQTTTQCGDTCVLCPEGEGVDPDTCTCSTCSAPAEACGSQCIDCGEGRVLVPSLGCSCQCDTTCPEGEYIVNSDTCACELCAEGSYACFGHCITCSPAFTFDPVSCSCVYNG